MKLGIVGVGRWGRVLASTFEKANVEVSAYNRADPEKFTADVGKYLPLPELIREVDVVAAAAPPEVTSRVFTACQEVGRPCLLTKPIMGATEIDDVKPLSATCYVDYIHLASPLYQRLKKAASGRQISGLKIDFHGDGPVRRFPGFYDYGAHALAMVHDLLGFGRLTHIFALGTCVSGPGKELVHANFRISGVPVVATIGNGAKTSMRRVEVQLDGDLKITYAERDRIATLDIDGKQSMRIAGHDPLSLLVERFLWDAEADRRSPYFLELSAVVWRSLMSLRRDAGLP
jgi:predicted dehydrogenase